MAERKRTTKKSVRQAQDSKVAPARTPRPRSKKTVLPEATPMKPAERKQPDRRLPDFLRFGESYSSLVLGIIVVIAVAALLVSFTRTGLPKQPKQDTSSTSTQVTEQPNEARPGSIYTVEEGDDLWNIAEKAYADGNLWGKIAEANKITDPDQLSIGTKIRIPETGTSVHLTVSITPTVTATVTPTFVPTTEPTAIPTVAEKPTPTIASNQQPTGPPQAAVGKSYTVVSGDTLWDIAVRAYGDGYRWVDIAQANHQSNPDLIFPGDVFQLPK